MKPHLIYIKPLKLKAKLAMRTTLNVLLLAVRTNVSHAHEYLDYVAGRMQWVPTEEQPQIPD